MEGPTPREIRQELENQHKERQELIKEITAICEILEEWELSLGDAIKNEEDLRDKCEDLILLMKNVVSNRQWLAFLELENTLK